MDWAASTTPVSTSAREVSTIRAMKGAAEALSYIRAQPNVSAEEVEYHG